MKNVLIIRYEGFPFHVRMSKEIATIIDEGCTCELLVPEGKINQVNISKETGRDLSKEVTVHTFNNVKHHKIVKLFSNEIFNKKFQKKLKELLSLKNYDYIFVKDTKSLYQVFTVLKKIGCNSKVICTMYENSAWQAYDMYHFFGTRKEKIIFHLSGLFHIIKKIEKTFLPKCFHIIVVVEEAKQYLLDSYNLNFNNISVVHNVENLKDFDTITSSVTRQTNDPKPLISYVGSLGKHRGIELFLKSISLLKEDKSLPLNVAIVGASLERKTELEKLSDELGIKNFVQVFGYLSHVEAMKWIKRSHIGMIPHLNTKFVKTTIPNKLFQYMTAGSCCIASDVGPLKRIIEREDCGYIFKADDERDMAEKIREALINTQTRAEKGIHGRAAVVRFYNWQAQKKVYSKILS